MGEKNVRIGLFDSGVGGLTVLAACRRVLPQADYFYYGDNARAPYGNRTEGEIGAFVAEGLEALARREIDAAVLACNTATAVCAEAMRKKFDFPIVGMEPAVKPATEKYHDILVLATPRTAESGRLRALVGRFPQCNIAVRALPGLAGAIEAHLTSGTPLAVSDHLPADVSPQAVVLGCTHYVFCRREISSFYRCAVFDGTEGTARRVKAVVCAPTGGAKWSGNTKTNKSLQFEWSGIAAKKVVFLGEWAEINEKVYKQTFGTG